MPTNLKPLSELTPNHGQVLLRLIWRSAKGKGRFAVGAKTFDGKVNVELAGTQEASNFDAWTPLPEVE